MVKEGMIIETLVAWRRAMFGLREKYDLPTPSEEILALLLEDNFLLRGPCSTSELSRRLLKCAKVKLGRNALYLRLDYLEKKGLVNNIATGFGTHQWVICQKWIDEMFTIRENVLKKVMRE